MTDINFVDTNILVYARDPSQGQKQVLASTLIQRLWQERSGRVSAQVLSEYYVTLTRKLQPRVSHEAAWDDVLTFSAWNPQAVDRELLLHAREIEKRYQTSWWDATIIAAALAQRCKFLLSEDHQDGMVFEHLIVRNPFSIGVQERHTEYAATVAPVPRHRGRGRPARAPVA